MKMLDIAKRANVSSSTVSRALNKPDSVQKDTRERILKVIEELNYKPNLVARQFRTKKTGIILVIVPDITSNFFSKVVRGIQQVASHYSYKVILCDTENDIKKEREYLDLLQQKQADGAILLTARLGKNELENISKEFPIVLACEYINELDIPTVSIDNINSAKKITAHLVQLGHTKIAHITGHMNGILGQDRLHGFEQALIQQGIEIHTEYIREGDTTLNSGFEQMQKLLALKTPPTAVFAFNDETALGALKAATDKGLYIPNDVAIVGFDDLEIATVVTPQLTTINQSRYKIGRQATQLLVDLIAGNEITQKKFILEDKLVVRASCGVGITGVT
jgi:LacI family repressor for deo operon, udp, cdd, tsx, nupC, and nupG